ncbi:MAG TPA: hypothetical protein VMI92_07650 [Steroidobacteraceae bacterium]|nr:hypothetical protein [Steroidobacteraceae bacterium]
MPNTKTDLLEDTVRMVALRPEHKSGRVVSDERGHNVWEWHDGNGRYARDISNEDLQLLTWPPLRLMEEADVRMMSGTWRYEVQRDPAADTESAGV